MYYRKDLISKLPNSDEIIAKLEESITWEEFLELSRYFDRTKNPFYIFPADNYEGLVCSFMEILFNQNESFFYKDSINLESPEVKTSIKLLNDLINEYKITPAVVTDYEENTCYDYFIKNEGVFLRGWPSFTKDYKNILRSTKIDSLLGKAALPHLSGSRPLSVFGGWNMMISKYSEHKKEALEFLKFIIREETQKFLYETGAYLPVLSSIYEDENFLEKHPDLIYDRKLLNNGIHRPFLDNYTQISDIVSYYTNQVLKGNLSIDAALSSAENSLISGELIVR
jgi:multiple sugar transport system substrate-binding protein